MCVVEESLESIVNQKKSIEISTIQRCPLWVSRPSGIMNLAALPKKVVPQALLEMEDMGSCVSRYRKHPVVNSFESTSHAKKIAYTLGQMNS